MSGTLRTVLMPVRAIVLAVAAAAMLSGGALAVEPHEKLADPALEARARALSAELRCLVCQNQSIDDSNAELARDLRMLVRERIAAGESDRDVLDFVVARYGEFVLLRPPFNLSTLLLWLAPLIVLLGAVGYLFHATRQSRRAAPAVPTALSDEERASLEKLLQK